MASLETIDQEIAKRLLTFGFSPRLVSHLSRLSRQQISSLTGWALTVDEDEINSLLIGLMKKVLVEAHLTMEFGMEEEKHSIMRMILPSMVRSADADAQQGKDLQAAVERIWEQQRQGAIEAGSRD